MLGLMEWTFILHSSLYSAWWMMAGHANGISAIILSLSSGQEGSSTLLREHWLWDTNRKPRMRTSNTSLFDGFLCASRKSLFWVKTWMVEKSAHYWTCFARTRPFRFVGDSVHRSISRSIHISGSAAIRVSQPPSARAAVADLSVRTLL